VDKRPGGGGGRDQSGRGKTARGERAQIIGYGGTGDGRGRALAGEARKETESGGQGVSEQDIGGGGGAEVGHAKVKENGVALIIQQWRAGETDRQIGDRVERVNRGEVEGPAGNR